VSRCLLICGSLVPFVQLDLELLERHHTVTTVEVYEVGNRAFLTALPGQIRRHDVVLTWFAGRHAIPVAVAATALRTPMISISGGYDTADERALDYGNLRPGPRKWITRGIYAACARIVCHSEFARTELLRSFPGLADRAVYGHLALQGTLLELQQGTDPSAPRSGQVVTVGGCREDNWRRKGIDILLQTAALLPDVEFVLVGDVEASIVSNGSPPANLVLAGRLSDDELHALVSRSSVYFQPSRHEAFGYAVLEAMGWGSVPVVSRHGSLPEVVGSDAHVVSTDDPAAYARRITESIGASEAERDEVRQRAWGFTPENRQAALDEAVATALGSDHHIPSVDHGIGTP